jgi:hypothetical protein
MVISGTRIVTPLYTAPFSLATAALGVWLIVAPFALGYNVDGNSPAATTNDIATGIGGSGLRRNQLAAGKLGGSEGVRGRSAVPVYSVAVYPVAAVLSGLRPNRPGW